MAFFNLVFVLWTPLAKPSWVAVIREQDSSSVWAVFVIEEGAHQAREGFQKLGYLSWNSLRIGEVMGVILKGDKILPDITSVSVGTSFLVNTWNSCVKESRSQTSFLQCCFYGILTTDLCTSQIMCLVVGSIFNFAKRNLSLVVTESYALIFAPATLNGYDEMNVTSVTYILFQTQSNCLFYLKIRNEFCFVLFLMQNFLVLLLKKSPSDFLDKSRSVLNWAL